jgi:RNA polymerase sigma-70 factor (ECF subfamily)
MRRPANQLSSAGVYTFENVANPDETELIARAKSGDVDAFSLLAVQHQQRMYGVAFRFCGNHHDAEDLLQEALMRAYRSIGRFRGMSSFATWLSRIMLNSLLNHKRKKSPKSAHEITEGAGYAIPGSDRATYNQVLVGQILHRLDALPARQKLMFILKHQEGLTCEEIADQLGTTIGTVKKTLFRTIHQLRDEFQTRETALNEGHDARLPEIP